MSFHGKERETISQQVKAPKQTISTGACQRRLGFTSRVNWQFLLERLDVTERTINTISTRLCLPKYGVSVVRLVMSTGFAAEAGCLRIQYVYIHNIHTLDMGSMFKLCMSKPSYHGAGETLPPSQEFLRYLPTNFCNMRKPEWTRYEGCRTIFHKHGQMTMRARRLGTWGFHNHSWIYKLYL